MTLRATTVVSGLRYNVDDDKLTRAGYSRWWTVQRITVDDAWEIMGTTGREIHNESDLGQRVLRAVNREIEAKERELLKRQENCSHPWRHTSYGSDPDADYGTRCAVCNKKL